VVAIVGKKIDITYELIHVDLPLLAGSSFLLAAMVWDGVFTFSEGLLSIAGFAIYFLYTFMVESEHEHDMAIELEMKEKKSDLQKSTLLMTVLSAFFIYLGAKYTVESIIQLSEILSVGKEIIAASAVALGTSLPELIVSATAAREGKAELAIGNILGSNIFNSFTVMGVSALFGTLLIPQSILTFALPIMLVATILYVFMTQDKQITQWEGGLLLIFYIFYIGKLLNFL
jgi:cation:H+ antiporter